MNFEVEAIRNWIRDEVLKTVAIMHRPGKHWVCDTYNPNNGTAKGHYLPGNEPSGDLPVMSAYSPQGGGFASPPSPGDVCWVTFQEGSYNSGTVSHRLWNQNNPPPPAQSGESWLQHPKGQTIKMQNDQTMTFMGQSATDQAATLYDQNGFIIVTHPNPTVHYTKYFNPNNPGAPIKKVMLEDGTTSTLLRSANA